MGVQKFLPFSLHHVMREQAFGRVAWLLKQVRKRAAIKALPKHGSYLKRRLVCWL